MLPTLELLTRPGVLGFYTHVEVTEIVGFRERGAEPVNVLTLMVAEDRDGQVVPADAFLNRKPLRLPRLKSWSFGLYRYYRPISALTEVLRGRDTLETWTLSSKPLGIGRLDAQPPVLVPPDTYQDLPWNRVLKNNFWSGSYVLEWHDARKDSLAELLAQPPVLQELTAAIRSHAPVSITSLSDRIGNIVLQLPLTVVLAEMAPLSEGSGLQIEVAWHSKATPRPVFVEATRRYDGTVAGVARGPLVGISMVLPVADGPGDYESMIWDEAHGLVLAATGPCAFISVIDVGMKMIDPEPRVFETGPVGERVMQRVQVHTPMPFKVGEPITARTGEWTQRRIYWDDIERLAARRAFVQYKPVPATHDVERQRALADLRYLIGNYGRGGAYLWDPYLSAADILDTLYYCPTAGADLRGLTAMRVPAGSDEPRAKGDFVARQRATFQAANSNFRGLRLEIRGRIGARGWDFHDRFVIFPDTNEGPLAWSLGASVNSLGKQHHILQRVGDGQLIADAFLELWDQLDTPEHLIWKRP